MLETTARCAPCPSKLYPRLDQTQAEDQAGFRSFIPNNRSSFDVQEVNQNVDSDSRLHEGVRLHHPQINLGRPQIMQHRTWLHPPHETRKPQCWQTKKVTYLRLRKKPNMATHCQACSSTRFCRKHWKKTFRAGKKRGMGTYLSDNGHVCLTNMRFADDVFLFASSKEQLQKRLCDFKRSTEKVGLRIHPGKTKILSNQSSNIREEIEIDDIKVKIWTSEENTKYLGQMMTFQQQETTEIRNRIRAAWATFHKCRQELASRTYRFKHRLRLFDAVISPTMSYASGTWTLTQEHERMIQSTQRKMLRLIIQTKWRYKKIAKNDETKENDDTEDLGSTEEENEDGQSSNTHNHQDSDIFRKRYRGWNWHNWDWGRRLDWIHKKRCTDEALDKMEDAKIRCWIKTHIRVKWRMALKIASLANERWMVNAAE